MIMILVIMVCMIKIVRISATLSASLSWPTLSPSARAHNRQYFFNIAAVLFGAQCQGERQYSLNLLAGK